MGRTLWQILTEEKPDTTPLELKTYNPLKTKVGDCIVINDDPMFKNYNNVIEELRVYNRAIGNKKFPFADYQMVSRTTDDRDFRFKLRLLPNDRGGSFNHSVIALWLLDEFGYSEDFEQIVNDPSGEFFVNEDENGTSYPEDEHEIFWRINEGVKEPYNADVSIFKDLDEDGSVEEDEVEKLPLKYWDFWRETQDEKTGVKFVQFLFVEMNKETGYFEIWRGHELPATEVMVI